MNESEKMIRPETLSALNVLYSAQKSPIQVLVPIFVDVIYREGVTEVSPESYEQIKKLLNDRIGLKIPGHLLTLICDEALAEGFFINNGLHKPLILNLQKAKDNDLYFSKMELESTRKWKSLRNDIIERYDRFGYGAISEKKADLALLEFIKMNSSSFLLECDTDGENLASSNGSVGFQELTRISICLAEIAKNPQSDNYQYLVDLCLGNSFASAIFWWDDEENKSHLKNLNVYLDSPIIFRLLGFGSEGQEEVAIDLVKTLKDRGARLFVFDHVLSEVIDVFEGAKTWIGNPEYDPSKASKTSQKVIELKLTPIDLEKVIDEIPEKLETYGIKQEEAISPNILREYQIDECKLHHDIKAAYELRDRDKDATIDVDVKSIGAINKLRKSNAVIHLNKAQAVLCTSNKTLSNVSFDFEQKEYNRPNRSIPLCMTDVALVTIAWLESPGNGRRIAQRRVIAQVNALIEPTYAIKRKFCDDLRERREAKIITNAEYLAIIRESTVNKILARKTGNDPSLYTGEMIDEAIEELIERKSIQKNIEIKEHKERIKDKEDKLAKYRDREDRKADRTGTIVLSVFVAIVTFPSVISAVLFPEYRFAVISIAIIANVLIAIFSGRVKQLGVKLYKRFNPDFGN